MADKAGLRFRNVALPGIEPTDREVSVHESLRASDLVFEPPTPAGTGMLSWDKHELLFEQGYRYGAEQLERMERDHNPGLLRINAALS